MGKNLLCTSPAYGTGCYATGMDANPALLTAVGRTSEAQYITDEFIAELEKSGRRGSRKIVTRVEPAKTFWPAEDYHQDYYEKNPVRYHYYRYRCGRDQRLEQLWGKPK